MSGCGAPWCNRGLVVDGAIWQHFAQRGWALDFDAARRRLPCRRCRDWRFVLILPARRPREEAISWERQVVRFFHRSRTAREKLKRVK